MDKSILQALYQYSSPEISDALDACGIHGYLRRIKPIGNSPKLIGPAYTIEYQPFDEKPKKFMQASNYIDEVPAGAVVIINNDGNVSCSVWGAILTHFAHHKKIAGTVVFGGVRDAHLHEKYNYPLYACGVTPRTGKNRVRLVSQKESITIEDVTIHFNDIVFADKTGTLIIPKEQATQILSMVQNISENESKIMKAIDEGKTLAEARDLYHYDTPWKKGK